MSDKWTAATILGVCLTSFTFFGFLVYNSSTTNIEKLKLCKDMRGSDLTVCLQGYQTGR